MRRGGEAEVRMRDAERRRKREKRGIPRWRKEQWRKERVVEGRREKKKVQGWKKNARVEKRVARKRGRTIRVGGKSEANGAGV